MPTAVSLRIPEELKEELDELAGLERADRSRLIREILRRGVQERRVEHALERYKNGDVSLGKAAEIARLSLWEMFDEMAKRGVELNYGPEEVEEDIRLLEASR